jgi:uncharacterized Zn-binding protein involved in type VI secretion
MATLAAARRDDPVTGVDTHVVLVPSPPGAPVPTPLPHQFSGKLVDELSGDVEIDGLAAATAGSVARNSPAHRPTPPGTAFQRPPSNRGTVTGGSGSVLVNGRAAARVTDKVRTCNDPQDLETATITGGSGTVLIG